MERKILGAMLQSRSSWEQAQSLLKKEDLSPEGTLINDLVSEFYTSDPEANSCDIDILSSRISRRVSNNKHVTFLTDLIKQLSSLDISQTNVLNEVREQQAHIVGLELAAKLAAGAKGKDVNELLSKYQNLLSSSSSDTGELIEFVGVSPADLVTKHFSKENLIELWPPALNDMIDGGVKPGHHVLVFAPTEMGKTLFVINAVAGFLKQGLRVLYCGNEDPAPDILMRMISRLTGLTKYEVQNDPKNAEAILQKRNWDNLVVASLSPGTFQQINKLVDKYDPDVVVLDQLRNIAVDSENRTQALEKAATQARNLAKGREVVVLSVTQAGDSASKKTILGRGDVDSSNVGIPGQVDLMIGIGATEEMESRGMRTLSFPKNKISGKHEPITVTFNYVLSKVEQ